MPELSPSTRTRQTVYHDAITAAGVSAFTVYNHMLLPTVFETAEADYWALVNTVSMWDVSVERQVEITGPDAFELVTRLTPRNLTKTRIGMCRYVPLCDERGGMINDPVLLRLADDHFWLSIADADVLLWAKGLAYGMGLDVSICEPDVWPLAIQGPRADDVAAALLGDWVRDLRFFRFSPFDLDDIPLLVARSGWSRQGGFELYLRDGSRGTELWERVAAAGEPFDIRPGSPSTMERVEAGLLSYGNDMTLDDTPLHVGLDTYCDLTQDAAYIGKDALNELAATGVDRRITGVRIDGPRLPSSARWWPILGADGDRIGEVRSAAWSPRLEANLGLAMLPMTHQPPGTVVSVETADGVRSATAAEVPFIG